MTTPSEAGKGASFSAGSRAPRPSPAEARAGDLLAVIAERIAEHLVGAAAVAPDSRAEDPVSDPEREWQQRPVLSATQAADLLGVSRALVYELIRRRELPSVRLGRRVLVPSAAIARLAAVRARET